MERFCPPGSGSLDPTNQPFVDWLWGAMESSSIRSRNRLADRTGYPKTSIYAWFAGKGRPGLEQARDLAEALTGDRLSADAAWTRSAGHGVTSFGASAHQLDRLIGELNGQIQRMASLVHSPQNASDLYLTNEAVYIPPRIKRSGIDDIWRSPAEIFAESKRIVLLGDPGSGKSQVLHHLAAKSSAGDGTFGGRAVFWLRIRDNIDIFRDQKGSVVDGLERGCRYPLNVNPAAGAVAALLQRGDALVLVDGLDEAGNLSTRRKIAMLFEAFAMLYPEVAIVASCRSHSYEESPFNPSLFTTAVIAPFHRLEISDFVARFFGASEKHPGTVVAPNQAEKFLTSTRSLGELTSNPLLLTLLCQLHARGEIDQRNEADIYDQCATLFFEDWDEVRGVDRDVRFAPLIRAALCSLARRLFESADSRPSVSRAQAIRVLARHLLPVSASHEVATRYAVSFLQFCVGRQAILVPVEGPNGTDHFAFGHQTFLEFFVAAHIASIDRTVDEIWSELQETQFDARWHLPNLYAIGLSIRDRGVGSLGLIDRIVQSTGLESEVPVANWLAARAISFGLPSLMTIERLCVSVLTRITGEYFNSWNTRPSDTKPNRWEDAFTLLWMQTSSINVPVIARQMAKFLIDNAISIDSVAREYLCGDPWAPIDTGPVAAKVWEYLEEAEDKSSVSREYDRLCSRAATNGAISVPEMLYGPTISGLDAPCMAARILIGLASDHSRVATRSALENLAPWVRPSEFPWVEVIYDFMYESGPLLWSPQAAAIQADILSDLPPDIRGIVLLLLLPYVEHAHESAAHRFLRDARRGTPEEIAAALHRPVLVGLSDEVISIVRGWLYGEDVWGYVE